MTQPIVNQSLPAFPIADYWIVLLDVVPVHLSAKIVVSAGVAASIETVNPLGCDANHVRYRLKSTVTPSVRADLFASAAVDVIAAEAGVRANLNLITFGLPFEVGVDAHTTNTGVVNVDLTKSLGVDLHELGGSVELYAELHAFFKNHSTSRTLFSWGGFHQQKSLWSGNKTFPLDGLSLRLYGGTSNDFGGGLNP
jgi:hypothetical protein